MIEIGQKVPEMDLQAYHANDIQWMKLSDYKGKWLVLFFYPADFTFVCPTELEEMANLYEEFRKNQAEVLSVSTDTVYGKAFDDGLPHRSVSQLPGF